MTNETKAPLTKEERTAKMRAGRDKAGIAVRVARNDVLLNQEEYLNSQEFRAKHTGNSTITRMFADLAANREKYKVNPDGSKMTIDDEIAARNARGASLTAKHKAHLSIQFKQEMDAEEEGDEEEAA